jgi:hypothetical protein
LQYGQPISPQRFAHRRVGSDAANQLVVFAREHDGPRFRLASIKDSQCQARRGSAGVVDGALSDSPTFGAMTEATNGPDADLTADLN